MDVNDVNLSFVRYRIPVFELFIPGFREPYSIRNEFIGNFVIEKDYEHFLMPYMEFRCMVPDHIYAKVLENAENIYVHIKVDYGYFPNLEAVSDDALQVTGTLFDEKFYAFIDNKTPKLTDGTPARDRQLREQQQGGDTMASFDNRQALVMAVYLPDHLFNCNQIVNGVLSKCTTGDAVAYFMKKLGLKNVLMSPSDNPKIHEQLVIPPLAGIQGLLRTVNAYALHRHGTTVFFDYNRIYIVDKKLEATAWTNNEHRVVYLASFPARGETTIMRSGVYSNRKEKYDYINLIGNAISIENLAMLEDQLMGGNIVTIDSNTGAIERHESKISVADQSMSKQGKVNRIVVRNSGTASSEVSQHDIEQAQKSMTITVTDIDFSMLAPNRDYVFVTDNAKFRDSMGHYRITSATGTFTRESNWYTGFFTASFVGGVPDKKK